MGGAAVLQVSAFFPRHGGGIEVVAGEIAKRCASEVGSFTWLAGGSPSEVPAPGDFPKVKLVSVDTNDFLERWLGLPLPIFGWRGVRRLLREVKKAEVVHVHDYLYFSSILAILFARVYRKQIILTQHVSDIPFDSRLKSWLVWAANRSLGRFMMSLASQVTFISPQVLEKFTGLVRFKREPLLIRNGVDHSVYCAGSSAPSPSVKKLLFVGRFVEKKGIHLLREALDIPGVSWRFVGKGPLSPVGWPEFKDARKAVYEDVRGRGVVDFYHWADLLVLPSVGEGFPLVLQEALSCGVPVLVSEEVYETFPVTDDKCVFSVDCSGPEKAAVLRRKIENIIATKDLGDESRRSAVALSKIWCWDKAAVSYAQLYQGAIETS